MDPVPVHIDAYVECTRHSMRVDVHDHTGRENYRVARTDVQMNVCVRDTRTHTHE